MTFKTTRLWDPMANLLLLSLTLAACGNEATVPSEGEKEAKNTSIVVPPYTLIKSDLDRKDAIYRVQVGDTLPSEQEAIALFRKVTGIKEGQATRNTVVLLTRDGYSALADAQAAINFMKDDEAPTFRLQSASNETLKKAESLSFDSIPDKKLVVELLESQGSKIIIYQKPSSQYFKVLLYSGGSYDIESMKSGHGNSPHNIVLTKTEDGETFTYKEDDLGKSMDVYNGNNAHFNSYKIIKRGN